MYKACIHHGIKPIVGAEIRNNDELLYILLAANNKGMRWINQFLSSIYKSKSLFPEQTKDQPFYEDPSDGFIIYPAGRRSPEHLHCNEFIGIAPWEVNKLFGTNIQQYKSKFVVRQPVTFRDKQKDLFNIHKLLRAIDKNVLLSKLSPDDLASPQEYFVPPSEILEAFKHYSFIVTNTYKLIDCCNISMEYGTDKNKKIFSASKGDDRELLQKIGVRRMEMPVRK